MRKKNITKFDYRKRKCINNKKHMRGKLKNITISVFCSIIYYRLSALKASAGFDVNSVNNIFGLPNKNLNQIILDVTNWLVGLVIVLSFLVIVYGGVRYIAAAGSDDEVAAAKKIITYAVVGLIVTGLSWVIVYTVVNVVLK